MGYFFNPNAGLNYYGLIIFWGYFIQCLGSFCYPAPGSNVTTQCLGSFFSVTDPGSDGTQRLGVIVGILRRLLERAVLSANELKHFFGKYRFVYILFYWWNHYFAVYLSILCRATYRRAVWVTKRKSLASGLLLDEESALHKINDYIYKDKQYKCTVLGC